MMPITDPEVMNKSSAADFAGFYEEWFDKVYNYARHRTGSAVLADEIVSDTFARAFKGWHGYDLAKADRRTWLFSIAFRAAADHYRARKRRAWLSLDLTLEPRDPKDGPPQALERAQYQRRLFAALAELGEQAREAVSLKFFGGMTNRAIAELMGLTESNVGIIVFRSVRRLRESFSGLEADHE